MTENQWNVVNELIVTNKIHQGLLAKASGLSRSDFSRKLRGDRGGKLTDAQKVAIFDFIKGYAVDILAKLEEITK